MLMVPSLLLLVALSVFVHYETLNHCDETLRRVHWVPADAKVLLAIVAALCSHLAQIALFAWGYWLLQGGALGSLRGAVLNPTLSFFYFSAETYTSLGLGDIQPVGKLRLLAGIEALTGLLMIGWSASFTYLEMARHWRGREP
jgi:hypothetical protein